MSSPSARVHTAPWSAGAFCGLRLSSPDRWGRLRIIQALSAPLTTPSSGDGIPSLDLEASDPGSQLTGTDSVPDALETVKPTVRPAGIVPTRIPLLTPQSDAENGAQNPPCLGHPLQPAPSPAAFTPSHPNVGYMGRPPMNSSLQRDGAGFRLQRNLIQNFAIERGGQSHHHFDSSTHHYGDVYNNTNIIHGSITNVKHIDNAYFLNSNQDVLLWDSLPKQRDLSGQQSEYMEGSREDTVQYALTWGEDPRSELALFIYGAAGVGKSTLARHLTHRLHAASRLAASVSLSGIPTKARGPESVVKMIAREIGEKHPEAIPAILEAIRMCKGAPLEDHFERFLKDVVCSLKCSYPLIVLFDAIDEWESYGSLIRALPRLSSSASSLRFILLGRLDPRARGLDDASIHLYPLRPVSKGIMERYFSHQFDSVRWGEGGRPSLSQTTQLAELANGLFIWAAIVCSLLKKRLSIASPNQTIEAILHLRRSLGENESLAGLYRQAFAWLFPDSEARELVRKYLGATLVLQEPLPIPDFSSLADLPAHATEVIQGDLTAFQIRQPTDDEGCCLVHPAGDLFHLSLLEFLQSTSTSTDAAFHISTFGAHSHLAESCLTNLPHFLAASRNITSLHLSPQGKYIVKYLATHAYKGTPSVRPGSSAEWSKTRHYHLLQQLGIAQLLHWGSLLLDLVKPGSSLVKEGEYADNEAGGLMRDIAAALDGDSALRSFQISCLEVAGRLQPEDVNTWLDLGWAYWQSANHTKDVDAGQRAVVAHQNVLDIVEGSGSSDRAYALYSLATSLHTCFELIGNTQDLDRSISLHKEALALRPPGHASRAESLGNLAVSLTSSSKLAGPIDEIIHLEREALDLRPPGHTGRALCLRNLAATLHSRFKTTASLTDVEEAVRLRREALELSPPGHADRVTALQHLASSLQSLSQTTGSTADLDEAVELRRKALELCPPLHANRDVALEGLAVSLDSRFQTMASTADLDEAVKLRRELLELHPPGHADYVTDLQNLAISLQSRSKTTASTSDLDEGILLFREALELTPSGHAGRATALQNLTASLGSRSQRTASTADSHEMIQLCRDLLKLRPPGHADRAASLQNLAASLWARAQTTASASDVEEAVKIGRELLELCPPGHASRSAALQNLAISLQSLFQMTACTSNLDEAIQLRRDVLELRPPGHAGCISALQSLAASLQSRSKAGDSDEAVQLRRKVLELHPPGHANRVVALQGLASSLHSQFQTTRSVADLNEDIILSREVLKLRPPGHAARVAALLNLAISLQSRSTVMSSTADLDEVVQLRREALKLRPPGHADRVASLRSLTSSLHLRLETTVSIADIKESISLSREVLEHCPLGHTDRARSLNSLSWGLIFRYQAQGLIQDIEESISLGRDSLVLLPAGHPDRCNMLDTLAKALHFKPEHLDEALQLSRESVSLIPPGNHQDWEIRMTLATVLLRHHESSGSVEELQEATSVCKEALSECSPNHHLRPKLLDLQAKLAEAKSNSPSQP